jgi:hypothetical protein
MDGVVFKRTRHRTTVDPIRPSTGLDKMMAELYSLTTSFLDPRSQTALVQTTQAWETKVIKESQLALKSRIQSLNCTTYSVSAKDPGARSVRRDQNMGDNDPTIWQDATVLTLILDDPNPPSLWYDAYKNATATTKIVFVIQLDACTTPIEVGSDQFPNLMEYHLPSFEYSMHHDLCLKRPKDKIFQDLPQNHKITDLEIQMSPYGDEGLHVLIALCSTTLGQILEHAPTLHKLQLTDLNLGSLMCLQEVTTINWPSRLKRVALHTCGAYQKTNRSIEQYRRLPFREAHPTQHHLPSMMHCLEAFHLEAKDSKLPHVETLTLHSDFDHGYRWDHTLKIPDFLPKLQKVYTGEILQFPFLLCNLPDHWLAWKVNTQRVKQDEVSVVVARICHADMATQHSWSDWTETKERRVQFYYKKANDTESSAALSITEEQEEKKEETEETVHEQKDEIVYRLRLSPLPKL